MKYTLELKSKINDYKQQREDFQEALGEFFTELNRKEKLCKKCKLCCCRDCKNKNGYYNSIDEKYLIPRRYINLKIKYDKKKGCLIPYKYRSTTCIYHTCSYIRNALRKYGLEDIITNFISFYEAKFLIRDSILMSDVTFLKRVLDIQDAWGMKNIQTHIIQEKINSLKTITKMFKQVKRIDEIKLKKKDWAVA